MFKKTIDTGVIKDIKQIIIFMKITGVRLKFFVMSLVFSLGLALFNLYTVALLFPLVQGIINNNFDNVKDIKIVGSIITRYPDFFNTPLRLFVLLIIWIYLNIILKNVLQYISSVSIAYQVKSATINMRNLLFDKCLEFGKSFYDKNKTTDIHWIVTESSDAIEEQFWSLQNLIIDTCLIMVYSSAMLFISWKLTIVCGLTFPIVNTVTKKIIKKIKESSRNTETAAMIFSDRIFNILSCIPLVKGFAKENHERKLYQAASRKEIEESFKVKKISSLLGPIEDIGITTSILLLAFGMATVLYFDKSLNSSVVFIFFYLAQNLINKLNSINCFKLNLAHSGKEVDEINNLLKKNNEHTIPSGKKIFNGIKEKIEIKNLDFFYEEGGQKIIKNLSLVIPKGKITAIVGPTGSGKSTIANLLLRFYDCPANAIFIDDVDIRNFNLESLHKKISFINQDSLLFNDTVRYNITYSLHKEISDDEIISISEKTVVHDFVNRLPEKYETIISEHGSNLSGGEKQRIAITRALIKDYEILIMDEATSSLDANTEKKVVDAISDLAKDKTTIIISHRLSTIKDADNIVFVKNGEVKESGTLEEMINLKGLFYNDWMAQKI